MPGKCGTLLRVRFTEWLGFRATRTTAATIVLMLPQPLWLGYLGNPEVGIPAAAHSLRHLPPRDQPTEQLSRRRLQRAHCPQAKNFAALRAFCGLQVLSSIEFLRK
jgi:hypothetical protein